MNKVDIACFYLRLKIDLMQKNLIHLKTDKHPIDCETSKRKYEQYRKHVDLIITYLQKELNSAEITKDKNS